MVHIRLGLAEEEAGTSALDYNSALEYELVLTPIPSVQLPTFHGIPGKYVSSPYAIAAMTRYLIRLVFSDSLDMTY